MSVRCTRQPNLPGLRRRRVVPVERLLRQAELARRADDGRRLLRPEHEHLLVEAELALVPQVVGPEPVDLRR